MISSYSQVCPVIFGEGAVEELGKTIKELNGKKALCVYDQGVKAAGIADKIQMILSKEEIGYAVFEGVQADPTDEIVNTAAQIAKDEEVDIVIGIGGGSSLDAAKAIAVLIKNPGEIREYYAGGKPFAQTAPLILLPTASGTGSESTPMAVITDTESKVKQTVLNHADRAIVDPELTLTVPAHVTAATGFDALSHAVEAYTVNVGYANPMSDLLALKAVELISDNLEAAYLNGDDLEARTALSLGSNFAGIAFSAASVHIGHVAAHEIGARFHIPHGVVCALTLPETILLAEESFPEKIRDIARMMHLSIIDEKETGKRVAAKIRERMHSVGIRSLKSYELTREEVINCAADAIKNNWFVVCAPVEVNVEVMKQYLGNIYDNYE